MCGLVEDPLDIDPGEPERHLGILLVPLQAKLGYLGGPLPQSSEHRALLGSRDGGRDATVVQIGQPTDGESLERSHVRNQSGEQQRFDEAVIGVDLMGSGKRLGLLLVDFVIGQEYRPDLLVIEVPSPKEMPLQFVGEGLFASSDNVIQVTQGYEVADGKRVPLPHEELEQEAESGALTLQITRDRHERLDQGWRKRVDASEGGPVRVRRYERVQRPAGARGQLFEGCIDDACGGLGLGFQQALLHDCAQVRVGQLDRVETTFPPLKTVAKVEALRSGHTLSEEFA